MKNHIRRIKGYWDLKAKALLSRKEISLNVYKLILIENEIGMKRALKERGLK